MKLCLWIFFATLVCCGKKNSESKKSTVQSDHELSTTVKDASIGGITCELQLDIVSVSSNVAYPVGLGLKVNFKNHTKDNLFINFNSLTQTRDGRRVSFDPGLIPEAILLRVDSPQCLEKPRQTLVNFLCDSIFNEKNYLQKRPRGMDIIFCRSFLFLEAGESFECTKNITHLVRSFKAFTQPGTYKFHFTYDPSEYIFLSKELSDKIPSFFKGYKRYNDKVVSNEIVINVR